MRSFDDARALVKYAIETQLPAITPVYEDTAGKDTIPVELLIQTKHLLDSLRSALDYTAYGLCESALGSPPESRRVYYPWAWATEDETAFRRRVEKGLRDYVAARPDVVDRIVRFQHFAGYDFAWVPRFMNISNSRKHKSLGDQLPIVVTGFSIEAGLGCSLPVAGDKLVVPAGSLTIGPLTVPPGEYTYQEVANHLPRRPGFGVQRMRPNGVVFADDRTIRVLPFLDSAVRGVDTITEQLIGMA